VTRGQLRQRAGSLGLNAGGTAAAVPPQNSSTHATTAAQINRILSDEFYQDQTGLKVVSEG